MKANLYIMGVYQGEIEIGEESIIGLLCQGSYRKAGIVVKELQRELNTFCEASCSIGLSRGETGMRRAEQARKRREKEDAKG